MSGLMRLTDDQRLRLDTEVAVIEAAIAELDAFGHEDIDPTFHMLIGLSATQLRLGLSSIAGITGMHRRLADG